VTDHYQTLGLERAATLDQVTRAWREAASKYHPDRPQGDAEKFRAAREAFEVLSNPVARIEYDLRVSGRELAPQLTQEGFEEMANLRSGMSISAQLKFLEQGCPVCADSREVRVLKGGFWLRKPCPACA